MKVYPDRNLPAVALIDPYALDSVPEQTQFEQDTRRRSEKIRSTQEARSLQIRRQILTNLTGLLRAKMFEKPENTTEEEDLRVFARKQFSINNFCKRHYSVTYAFSKMGPSVTETLLTACTNGKSEKYQKNWKSEDLD